MKNKQLIGNATFVSRARPDLGLQLRVVMILLSRSRSSLGFALLLLALAYSRPTHAQEAPAAEEPHLRGLEVMLRPALGGALSDSGNKKAALAELEMARKLDPDNDIFRTKE